MFNLIKNLKLNHIKRNQFRYFGINNGNNTIEDESTSPIAIRHLNDVLIIHLNRPKVANALNDEMGEKLIHTLKYSYGKMKTKAIIITGNYIQGNYNKINFSSGRDLKLSLKNIKNEKKIQNYLNLAINTTRSVYNLPIPTIAAIQGGCYGWGLELALACDLRIVHPDAKLSFPETKIGIFPGSGGLYYLKQLQIPSHITYDLVYTARVFNGIEAKELNLVNEVSEEPLNKALEIAEKISKNNSNGIMSAKNVIQRCYTRNQQDELMEYSKNMRLKLKLDVNKIKEILKK